MKPAWDQLIGDFEGHKTALVADVDCTAGGQDLCEKVGVRGYPTIKWGDPNNLEDYEGGRDYDDLKKFAEENLKPVCSPANIDLCNDEQKANIEKYTKMSDAELDEAIKAKEKEQEDAESTFTSEVEKLQKKYEELSKEKDDALAGIKTSGLGTMKAVKASR
jgi:hypothetical protein